MDGRHVCGMVAAMKLRKLAVCAWVCISVLVSGVSATHAGTLSELPVVGRALNRIAVAHKKFKKIGFRTISKLCKENHVIYDLKFLFKKKQTSMRL